MSMDDSAVQRIGDLALQGFQALQPTTDRPVLATPDNFTLHDLEKHMANRYRFRGVMFTDSLEAFADYSGDRICSSNSQVKKSAACFVNRDQMKAELVFNVGDDEHPGHADDRAALKLPPTPEYQSLLDAEGIPLSQRQLAEWMEDWQDNITCYARSGEDGELEKLSTPRAVSAVRSIKIEQTREGSRSEHDLGESASALEKTEVQQQQAFPSFIHFTCHPYDDLSQYDFKLRLSVSGTGDCTSLKLRMARKQKVEEQIAQEFADQVESLLVDKGADDIPVYIGSFTA